MPISTASFKTPKGVCLSQENGLTGFFVGNMEFTIEDVYTTGITICFCLERSVIDSLEAIMQFFSERNEEYPKLVVCRKRSPGSTGVPNKYYICAEPGEVSLLLLNELQDYIGKVLNSNNYNPCKEVPVARPVSSGISAKKVQEITNLFEE